MKNAETLKSEMLKLELRPHEAEAIRNKFDAPRLRVFERVIDPRLKARREDGGSKMEDGITDADVLADAKGIVARALARGAAKIVPEAKGKTRADHAERKTTRKWSAAQRARRSKVFKQQYATGERKPVSFYVKHQTPSVEHQTSNTKHQAPI